MKNYKIYKEKLKDRSAFSLKRLSTKTYSAFSLIELSIVLIVVAFIIGGVISGKSLINNSKLINTSSDIKSLTIAIQSFKNSFDYLPGDMSTKVSGIVNKTGNGDFLIGDGTPTHYESLNAFAHLSKAGMIDKKFETEYESDIANDAISELVYPKLKSISDTYLYIAGTDFGGDFNKINRVILYNAKSETGNALSGKLAKQFDCKFDDCNPLTGQIVSNNIKLNSSSLNTNTNTNYINNNFIYLNNIQLFNDSNAAETSPCLVINANGEIDYNIGDKSNSCSVYQAIDRDESNSLKSSMDSIKDSVSSGKTDKPIKDSSAYKNCTVPEISKYESLGLGSWKNVSENQSLSHSSEIRGNCQVGYIAKEFYLKCNDGNWNEFNVEDGCTAVQCNNLSVSNATFDKTTLAYKEDALNGTCNIGFDGFVSAICNADKEWVINNTCTAVQCNTNDMEAIGNATFTENITLTYNQPAITGSCNAGFNGSISAICNADKTWEIKNECIANTCSVSKMSAVLEILGHINAKDGIIDFIKCKDAQCSSTVEGPIVKTSTTPINQNEYIKINSCGANYVNNGTPRILKCNINGEWELENKTADGGCKIKIDYVSLYGEKGIDKTGYTGIKSIYKYNGEEFTCSFNVFGGDPHVNFDKICRINGIRMATENDVKIASLNPAKITKCSTIDIPGNYNVSTGIISKILIDSGKIIIIPCRSGYAGKPTATCNNGNWTVNANEANTDKFCYPGGCDASTLVATNLDNYKWTLHISLTQRDETRNIIPNGSWAQGNCKSGYISNIANATPARRFNNFTNCKNGVFNSSGHATSCVAAYCDSRSTPVFSLNGHNLGVLNRLFYYTDGNNVYYIGACRNSTTGAYYQTSNSANIAAENQTLDCSQENNWISVGYTPRQFSCEINSEYGTILKAKRNACPYNGTFQIENRAAILYTADNGSSIVSLKHPSYYYYYECDSAGNSKYVVEVHYGRNKYSQKKFQKGSLVYCGNSTFGDPDPSQTKSCYKPGGAYKYADEGNNFYANPM